MGGIFLKRVILTFILAIIGGYLGDKMKLPAGALIGSMVFVGAANLSGADLQIPEQFNILAQSIIGGVLGLSLKPQIVAELKNYLVPSLMVVVLLAIFGVLVGLIVSWTTVIDIYTSMFGSVPGGMQEMIVLAQSYDVNHPAVLVIQTVRRILIVVIYPFLIKIVSKIAGSFPDYNKL
jgi:hypothetical protein